MKILVKLSTDVEFLLPYIGKLFHIRLYWHYRKRDIDYAKSACGTFVQSDGVRKSLVYSRVYLNIVTFSLNLNCVAKFTFIGILSTISYNSSILYTQKNYLNTQQQGHGITIHQHAYHMLGSLIFILLSDLEKRACTIFLLFFIYVRLLY